MCEKAFTTLFTPFKWLGLNSILIYLLACTDILPWLMSLFYYDETDQSLYDLLWPTGKYYGPDDNEFYIPTRTSAQHKQSDVLVWCILYYIPMWMCVAGYLHNQKIYLTV